MKHLWKRSLALFLSLVFLFSLAPAPAYAEDPAEEEEAGVIELAAPTGEENPETATSLELTELSLEEPSPDDAELLMEAAAAERPESVVISGFCGENVTYSLDSYGRLTISGTGNMEDYNSGTAPWYEVRNDIKKLTIESGVTSIGSAAFYDCALLNSVTIPSTVTAVKMYAFCGCHALMSITLPDSVTSIGTGAFWACSRLMSITIPPQVTTLEYGVFARCSELSSTTIPESVTEIKELVFSETKLTSVTIPSYVESIGNQAFSGCTALKTIRFEGCAPTMGSNTFYNVTATAYYPDLDSSWTEEVCGNYGGDLTWEIYPVVIASGACGDNLVWALDSVGTFTVSGTGTMTDYSSSSQPWRDYYDQISDVRIESGATSVGQYAFYQCTGLASLTLPESVTSIGRYAFSDCSGLTSATVSGNMEYRAFSSCSSLNSLTILEGLSSIGENAFDGCGALASVTIPLSVTSIESHAFYQCTSLTSMKIPSNVSSIGAAAFQSCSNLSSLTISEGVSSIGQETFKACSSLTSVTMPDTVTTVGRAAFQSCSNLLSVTIPGSVNSIGQYTFDGCPGLTSAGPCGSGCSIEFGWTASIPTYAFSYCRSLASVTIPGTVTSIGTGAFSGCSSLISITIPGTVTSIGTSAFSGCSSLTSVTLQEGVASIGNLAFNGCSNLVSVSVPESLTDIGHDYNNNAFSNCSNLKTVGPVGSGSNIEIGWTDVIPNYAFYNCSYLTSATIPEGVIAVGENAFTGCSSLTLLVFPEGLITIGKNAFQSCSELSSVAIPDSVTDIGDYAFAACKSLNTLIIPDSVTTLGQYAFTACSGLTTATIGASAIEGYAFNCCTSLASVEIGTGVSSVKNYAFYGCSALKSIRFWGPKPTFGSKAFYVLDSVKVYYPESQWSSWRDVIGNKYGAVETWWYSFHDRWGEPEYIWADDNSTVTATRICGSCGSTQTETANTNSETLREATCLEPGELILTASFTNPAFETQSKTVSIPALGHDWGEPAWTWTGYEAAEAVFTCGNDPSHTQSVAASIRSVHTEPDCENEGSTVYTAEAVFQGESYIDTRTEVFPAWGHSPSETVVENEEEPDCENPGSYDEVLYCSSCGEELSRDTVVIPALGHVWGEPSYTWAEDNSAVTAARTCAHDAAHVETETVNTVSEITKPATCEDWGETTYTVRFENPAFEPQTKTVVNIEPLGHDWSEPVWTWTGYESATAAFTCKRDAEHTKTLDAVITVEVIEPTTHEEGLRTYTARVELDGTIYEDVRTETIPQLLAPPEILAQPQSAQADEGTLAVFAVEASGGELSYQWQWSADGGKTWKNSSSATVGYNEATLQVAAAASRNGYRYRCVISNSEGSVTSEAATLTVITKPAITAQPESVSAAEQATVKFSVKATGGELSYQWQWSKDGKTWKNSSSATVGYNTDTLQVQAALSRSGYRYRCRVSNRLGEVTSSVATLTVIEIPVITVQPESVTVEEGETARFTVSAQGAGLSYQWQWSKDGKTWNNSSSATVGYNTATLQVTASESRNGYQYRCKVTNSKGTATSEPATLTVNGKPVITAQPESVTAGVGGTVTFTVSAQGTGLSYQWQWSKDGKTWNNSSSATVGYNTATLQVTASESRNGYRYRCKVTNSKGTAISEPATLTVSGKPVITAQPQSVTAAVGGTVKFTVSAQGTGLSYQWQWSRDGKTWNNSSSATVGYNTATLQVTASESRNGYQYRCKVTNSKGTAISEPATLTVSGKPVITAQPQSVTAAVGETAEFTVAASGSNLSYQWQWRAGESGTWANSSRDGNKTATLSVLATAARNGQQYRCVITNSDGTVYSAPATLTVTAGNALTAQPFSFRIPCAA